jgi:diguanylate cyclase (GGDEF)-like protein
MALVTTRRPAGWIVYLAAGVGAIIAYYTLPRAGVGQAVLLTLLNGTAAVAAYRAAARTHGQTRVVWVALGVSMTFATLANGPYYGFSLIGHPLPFPSAVDALFLLTYPCYAVALMALAKQHRERDRSGDALDSAILIVGGASLMWQFVISGVVHASGLPLLAHAVSTMYPVMDLIVFAMLVRFAVASAHRTKATHILLASFTLLLVADVVYALGLAAGTYAFGGPTDGLWMSSYLLIGVAATHPSAREFRLSTGSASRRMSHGRIAFLCAAVLAGPLLAIGHPKELVAVAIAAAVSFGLVMVRMTGLNRQLASAGVELNHRASTDSLTGLANRSAFADRLLAALATDERRAGTLSVLFIDLDDFKDVNDSLGHAAGDELLRVTAQRLDRTIRPGDLVARLGGDEFAILLDGIPDADSAFAVAERVVTALREPAAIGDAHVQVGASVGMAMRREDSTLDALMRDADVAMYSAKAKGKNRVEHYDADLHHLAVGQQALRAELDGAAERGELVVEYQPVVDLETGDLVGFEALVRWQHATQGLLPPSAFIALAEEPGAIVGIGASVMETAARQLRQWQQRYHLPKLWMSVNVSVRQLDVAEFADSVTDVLREAGIDPTTFVLEVTESVLADPDGGAAATLAALRGSRVRVALDDFGTGYSSIGYLQQLPVDILKIDRSFVSGPSAGTGVDDVLLEAIVAMGQTLRLDVIPEGIEELDQLVRLRAAGCKVGQGFLFSRPVSAQAIEVLLASPIPLPVVALIGEHDIPTLGLGVA